MTDYTPHPDKAVLNQLPVSAWAWPRIAVFVPMCPSWAHADHVFANFWSIAMTGTPLIYRSYGRTDVVRNEAAEELLKGDYTHILMLDSDQAHPGDIVQRLARWVIAEPTRRIVGGLYFRRGEPYNPLAWKMGEDDQLHLLEDWKPGLMEVDIIGTGAILIERSVFEELPRPWFYYDYSGINKPDFSWPTEDIAFCVQARNAGIQIWLDTTVDSPHAFTGFVSEKTYRSYQAMIKARDEQKELIPTNHAAVA